jgi:hypothetical protein
MKIIKIKEDITSEIARSFKNSISIDQKTTNKKNGPFEQILATYNSKVQVM